MSAILYVKWNGKRFPVEFTGTKELQDTTVRELKATCHHITGIDPKFMKINAFGAYMTQDDLPLSAYGLRSGCFITLKTMVKYRFSSLKKLAFQVLNF
ncbi:hypothetical protein BDF20DRAFT_822206 [Mycotypha africana]|uniref:uncharacterized protein n=1 Tax=Mycotypha africana TaxID=64632 RepID=UPI0023004101|nr:uncharacterized protein BDF20DRAFT_822206 [Mycotypha africana]KAI8975352.1 hypothetical protein BDF20DRAFT_822206 [Mycotypha africana]